MGTKFKKVNTLSFIGNIGPTVLDKVEEGGSSGKHLELVENADIMIETTHRLDAQRIYHRDSARTKLLFNCLAGARRLPTRENNAGNRRFSIDSAWNLAP
jgi:hypothetical protein